MNVYNADISRYYDFREQHKVLQVKPKTNMDVYNVDLSQHLPKMLEPNTYSDMNDIYTDLSYHRDIIEQRREMRVVSVI